MGDHNQHIRDLFEDRAFFRKFAYSRHDAPLDVLDKV
jgi:hypothetical protein